MERELIKLYEEYIEFLDEAMISPQQMAHVHGWRCPQEDVDKGIELRGKIKELKGKM